MLGRAGCYGKIHLEMASPTCHAEVPEGQVRSGQAGHGTPDPHPHPHPRFAGDRGWGSHPRFAGDHRGSTPTPTPDLAESGMQLSTIEHARG